jgi:hypothetical protein
MNWKGYIVEWGKGESKHIGNQSDAVYEAQRLARDVDWRERGEIIIRNNDTGNIVQSIPDPKKQKENP